jgi:hypothetical protein
LVLKEHDLYLKNLVDEYVSQNSDELYLLGYTAVFSGENQADYAALYPRR